MSKTKSLFIFAIFIIALVSYFVFSGKPIETPGFTSTHQSSNSDALPWPLNDPEKRQVLLKYGMYVTPDPNQNPISPPERFTGYHTGLDIEILPEEKDLSVLVKTICEGKLLYAGVIEGYGGVVIQECMVDNQPSSVLYGHLDPNSFKASVNEESVTSGTTVAELGDAYTEETGNTRKHLHLGIHKGNHIEFLGYIKDLKDLEEFVDPLPLLSK